MNGRRRKALRAQFRAEHGRDPRPTVSALVENQNTFVNEQGVRQFEAAYEKNGELHFRKIMGVGMPSEWRALKRSHLT